ncbi:hypothetical protein CC80DRAFT_195148 [Byssothecium circinans]|uniref:WSC domain-containing protein n=1 Tax=Byssothecium circinans TaxID=147558 RepID=A0A6A5UA92_9PLEO|nr:hypothetical protein CC80DRAFT_195148 [Byssothecium circinans]
MDRKTRIPFAGLITLLGLLLLAIPIRADGFNVEYCSTQNTGGGNAIVDNFQSNGYCTDKCRSSAYAVILDKSCWCSDYAPGADQHRTSDCSDNCPGFPSEKCGNKDQKLYIYIKGVGGVEPSGTRGAPEPTSSSKSATSATSTKSAPPSTTFQTSAAPVVPQTSVRVVTQSGLTLTQTVVSTPTAEPGQKQEQGVNKGAIIGGAVGGFLGLAVVAGVTVFLLFHRRRQQSQSDEHDDQNGVHRNVSTLSKSGLLRTEKSSYPPPLNTNVSNSRQSRNLDQDSISPISGSDRRNSRPMTDQRLNPNALFVFDNTSTGSLGTIDDSRDYNRTLNIRNPDP